MARICGLLRFDRCVKVVQEVICELFRSIREK
jgi:hypothetical protein